jgi:heat-inducible transcriptional repressor
MLPTQERLVGINHVEVTPVVPELTERRQLILKLVIQEFIDKASPVASESLVRRYELPMSSATVRHELATLEELGYLTQLHTSAGRIPTDAGYRCFVEHLMDDNPISNAEQMTIREQFSQARGNLEQWIQIAASLLAHQAKVASVVTPPRAYQVQLKHLELISINDMVMLMVLVLHGGTVKQQVITLDTPYTQQELRSISTHINERSVDKTAEGIEDLIQRRYTVQQGEFTPFEQHILHLVMHSMRQFEAEMNQQIHSDGLLEILSQPEFLPTLMKQEDSNRAIARMREMLELLRNSKSLGTLLLQALTQDDVQVIIGEEHPHKEMQPYSVILSRYGVGGEVAGVLGVIGPTRMSYPRSISAVRYLAVVMSDLLRELYGNEPHLS